MMNCQDARQWMSPYLDSELGQTKTFEISEHLQRCPRCESRFSAERRVDLMIRDRLVPEPMPDELWETLQRIPDSGGVFRWHRWGARLAMAAALALAATLFWPEGASPASPRMVSEFVADAPGGRPFTTLTDQTGPPESVADVLKEKFGLSLAMAARTLPDDHFGFALISAVVRRDHRGREYVEVRLNCCGEPVLLALAHHSGGKLPALFDGLPSDGVMSERILDGVHVASRTIGDHIAVIAARHPVSHILRGLRIMGTQTS